MASIYKNRHRSYFSSQIIQMILDDNDSVLNDNNLQNQVDLPNLILKKNQILSSTDPINIQQHIETIKNMIIEVNITANFLIENDFHSLFSFLIKIDTNVFYCSLYDLLSEIFKRYEGDIRGVVTSDILNFLNYLSDENPYIFISNLQCIINLLLRERSFKFFFIQNGGFAKLINYKFYQGSLEKKIAKVFNVITLIIENQDEKSLEYVFAIEEQKIIFNQIFQSLEFNISNVKVDILNCLDAFMRTCHIHSLYKKPSLICADELCQKVKAEIMKNIRLNNSYIIYLCFNIMETFLQIQNFDIFNINDIQLNIINIFGAFQHQEFPLLYVFQFLTLLADNIKYSDSITDDIVRYAIEFCDSDIFSIKAESIYFLATLIQMTSNSRTRSIVEKFPGIIEFFCIFIYSEEQIFQQITCALTKIIELCSFKEFKTQNNITINMFQIYELIDLDFLKDFGNMEEHSDFLIALTNIRYLISTYDNLMAQVV